MLLVHNNVYESQKHCSKWKKLSFISLKEKVKRWKQILEQDWPEGTEGKGVRDLSSDEMFLIMIIVPVTWLYFSKLIQIAHNIGEIYCV